MSNPSDEFANEEQSHFDYDRRKSEVFIVEILIS